jgi:hypothetical protein
MRFQSKPVILLFLAEIHRIEAMLFGSVLLFAASSATRDLFGISMFVCCPHDFLLNLHYIFISAGHVFIAC